MLSRCASGAGRWAFATSVAFAAAFLLCAGAAAAGPLHDAARSGDIDQLRQLLDAGGNLEDRDGTKETPLISAALAGHADIVAELIKRGADITARNDRGLTPLHAAAYGGNLARLKRWSRQAPRSTMPMTNSRSRR